MTNAVVDLKEKLSSFLEHWSPKVVARLNDYEIKVVQAMLIEPVGVVNTGNAGGRLTATSPSRE